MFIVVEWVIVLLAGWLKMGSIELRVFSLTPAANAIDPEYKNGGI
jgi:hypothetical protein